VGQVAVGGSSSPAVRINVNPVQLSGYGLGLENVRSAVVGQTANQAKGSFANANERWAIGANDQLTTAKDYAPLIVAYSNGQPVALSKVATVEDSVQTVQSLGMANGRVSALLIIFRQPGANIITTVDAIKAALPQLHASLDPAIIMSIGLDQTQTIRASVADIERTLLLSVALVVLVVFLFLRELRATLIPLIAVPASIIGTFAAMFLFGYSVDNLSLMALAISTGFVVDDAIVVLENITRYQEMGMDPETAAMTGAAQIGSTVMSMSLSLVAVFIPILLMGGIIGRLFREFAVVLSVAILVSLVVSLTTTPMMCSVLLAKKATHGKWYLASERAFNRILKGYENTLAWVLDHSLIVLIITLLAVGLNVFLYIVIPKGFFPQQDTGRLNGTIIADQSISFPAMQRKIVQLGAIAKQDPGVDTVLIFSGGGGGTTTNTGRVFVALKPLAERKATADQIINRLRPKLAAVAGATLFLQAVQDVRIGGRQSAAQYQYTIQSADLDVLNHWSPILLKSLKGIRQLTDMNSDAQNKGLAAKLVIDRRTAGRLGISPQGIDNVLYDAFGEREIATTYTQLNQYYVIMVVDPQFWQDPSALDDVYVAASGGGMVPLSAFTHYEAGTAPLAVNHSSVFPSVTYSFNLAPGVALGTAVKLIAAAERAAGVPTTITGSFSGTAQAFSSSLSSEPLRWRPCTWCSACCTRATFIRSPSSPRCRRPASGRCWRSSSRTRNSASSP
jgi:multidrug efflux pump